MKKPMCESCEAGEIYDVPAEYKVKWHLYKYVCEGHAEILLEDGEITQRQLSRL